MRLLTFVQDGERRVGALRSANEVVDVTALAGWRDMAALLAAGPAAWQALAAALAASDPAQRVRPLAGLTLTAPLTPGKIVAVGRNYLDHIQEHNAVPSAKPILFAKFPTSVIGPGEAIRWSPALTERVDWEAELAVVIGAPARRVPAARASEVIFGYTAANDVSARDLQFGDGQWVRGKSLDTFCPLGPWIVTRDEIADAQALTVSCTVNGERMQHANTAQMIFGIAALIEFITHSFTLLPGDIILTGTPSGVGDARKPPRFLHDGDVVTVELEGIGALTNPCREE
jgi:5-carboxymethyl-2-hydroxymuconate isomerase